MGLFDKVFKKSGGVQNYSAILLDKLLPEGERNGFIPTAKTVPNIPEIMMQARPVCQQLDTEMIMATMNLDGAVAFSMMMTYAAYVGVGAVWHWNKNWPELQKKGILNTMTEPYGVIGLDRYVTECVGLQHFSTKGMRLKDHLMKCSVMMFGYMEQLGMKNKNKFELQATECMMAMYCYGMILEMHQLGMH